MAKYLLVTSNCPQGVVATRSKVTSGGFDATCEVAEVLDGGLERSAAGARQTRRAAQGVHG